MIRGIGGKPYINLDPFINIERFKNMHYAICRGIAMTENKQNGIVGEPFDYFNGPVHHVKPLFQAIKEYNSLPPNHPIRANGMAMGEFKNPSKFVDYLKLSLNAYDPYQVIHLKQSKGSDEVMAENPWADDAKYFPELCDWIDSLVTNKVIKFVTRVLVLVAEHDNLTPMHRDLITGYEEGYYDHRHELIHLRTRLDKDFFIWDPDTNEYVLTDSHATFFNEQDWHSGGKCETNRTFSIRIDTEFTDEFRDKIGIGHLTHY